MLTWKHSPTSVFNDRNWIIATTTKICTTYFSTQTRIQASTKYVRPSTNRIHYCDCRVLAVRCYAIHFQDQFIRQVSCYTLLSGFRLPGPPSCCLYEPTPFLGSHEPVFGHLISTLGSSLIASSAYQQWPTYMHIRNHCILPSQNFEHWLRVTHAQLL